MTNLSRKTTAAAKWSAVDVIARQGVQFAISIVLARILAPADFGVVAMLAIFVAVGGIVIDSGFGSALIQRQNTTRAEESTVFYFNLAMGATIAGLFCLLAPYIAAFFGQPILRYLTYAMALNLLIGSLGSIHATLLNRMMDYKTLAKVGVVSSVLAGMLAVYLASRGYGVWSLAANSLASGTITAILFWTLHSWRPAWTFSLTSLSSFFRFGGYQMAATLTDVVTTNLYLVLIGKLYSARELGFYSRAQNTQQLPVTLMMGIINRVAFATFASVKDDKERLIRGLRQAQAVSMLINAPLMLGVVILAKPLVTTLFGDQWAPCVPILQVLGLGGVLWPLHVLNLNVLVAQGRSDLLFRLTIVKKLFSVTLTIAASLYGVMAIAWAQVVISLVAYFANAHYTKSMLNYGAWKQLNDLRVIFISVVPMAFVVYLLNDLVLAPGFARLILATAGGVVTYWLTCRILCADAMNLLISMVVPNGRYRSGGDWD
jgi:O-antigen/teichoic acid export membrane protein